MPLNYTHGYLKTAFSWTPRSKCCENKRQLHAFISSSS